MHQDWLKNWSFIKGNIHNINTGEMQTYFGDTSLTIDGLAQVTMIIYWYVFQQYTEIEMRKLRFRKIVRKLIQKRTSTPKLTAALFSIGKKWKQAKYPQTDGKEDVVCTYTCPYTHTHKQYNITQP